MSVSIKLSTAITWGSTGAGTSSSGKILSCTKKLVAKTFEQMDEDGELHSLVFYDQRAELSIEVLATATVTLPSPGDTITVGGVTDAIVTEAEVAWKSGDTTKINIQAFKSLA